MMDTKKILIVVDMQNDVIDGALGTKDVDINGSLIMVSLDDGRHVGSYAASQLEKAW